MRTPRRLICALGIAALGMFGATPLTAAAAGPVFVTQTRTVSTPSPNFSCRPYGDSFDVLSTFTVELDSIQFYEGSTLVKEIRHVDFTGTLYRSDDLSKTIPYAGKFTRTFDPATTPIRTAAGCLLSTRGGPSSTRPPLSVTRGRPGSSGKWRSAPPWQRSEARAEAIAEVTRHLKKNSFTQGGRSFTQRGLPRPRK